jgi:hypothetical protein
MALALRGLRSRQESDMFFFNLETAALNDLLERAPEMD